MSEDVAQNRSSNRSTPPRARELVPHLLGAFATGKHNAITDVEGVRVGHSTIVTDGDDDKNSNAARTGVTAILPNANDVYMNRVIGGGFVLNGAGEVAGLTQLVEWGLLESPILLTNTLAVGVCADAVVRSLVERYPKIGRQHDVVIPVVGECDDSWLNDIGGGHVRDTHVFDALENASSGVVEEGNVGGGTGMVTCDFKGGIGTSSRVLPEELGGHTVGVLVMSNFGNMEELRFAGLNVGPYLAPTYGPKSERRVSYGSIIVVVATDAPLVSAQLSRVAKRAALGIGRVGSSAAHGSGEIILAFSTANSLGRDETTRTHQTTMLSEHNINPIYRATVDATEEAILNALCAGVTMKGRLGRTIPGFPTHEMTTLLKTLPPWARGEEVHSG